MTRLRRYFLNFVLKFCESQINLFVLILKRNYLNHKQNSLALLSKDKVTQTISKQYCLQNDLQEDNDRNENKEKAEIEMCDLLNEIPFSILYLDI